MSPLMSCLAAFCGVDYVPFPDCFCVHGYQISLHPKSWRFRLHPGLLNAALELRLRVAHCMKTYLTKTRQGTDPLCCLSLHAS